jgi:hypothetical protein
MQADTSKILLLHADDYAIAPGVGEAVRKLIAKGRLSGTSAITGSRYWPEEAKRLKPLSEQADVGLHFTLTDQTPLADWSSFSKGDRLPSLAQIVRLVYWGQIPISLVHEEFERQLNAFTDAFGILPAYIDGHHHVHQLPLIRDIVLRIVSTIYGTNSIFMRNCYVRPHVALRRGIAPLKAIGLSIPGRGMAAQLKRLRLTTNGDFSGVYGLTEKESYSGFFHRFLVGADSGHLIMCHPGNVDDDLRAVDSFTTPRVAEYEYFAGPQFPELLAQSGFRIGRLYDLGANGLENEVSHCRIIKNENS